MATLPETILQFGSGRFLRAFVDLFISQANAEGQKVGSVVIVQSTGDERAAALNSQGGVYHVAIRGRSGGRVVDQVEKVESVSRALVATKQWAEVMELARSPRLRVILSNTTEAGYDLHSKDASAWNTFRAAAPRSFPAKLIAVLNERFTAGLPGIIIIPCELREHNAGLLHDVVLDVANRWRLAAAFVKWMREECVWLETLVDRIVTDPPEDHPLLSSDALLTVCEPYALWAIQEPPRSDRFLRHSAVVWTKDVLPYFLRKVRILNGAHTALFIKAAPRGFTTVREAVEDPQLGPWLERLLLEEVVPVLDGRCDNPAGFAREAIERCLNPYLEHQFASIATNHAAKVQIRLTPTRDEFKKKFGHNPPLLQAVLEAPTPRL
jgi:tagaturonate reductase